MTIDHLSYLLVPKSFVDEQIIAQLVHHNIKDLISFKRVI